jgi:hypothetical protein
MKVQDIKAIAQNMGIPLRKLNKTELVRAIQEKEGNNSCFDTGATSTCGQDGCLWKEDCK